jgi:hypothetical protein
LAEELLKEILDKCGHMQDSLLLTDEQIREFEALCSVLTAPQANGFSKLINTTVDLLYWYKVQNLFSAYLNTIT